MAKKKTPSRSSAKKAGEKTKDTSPHIEQRDKMKTPVDIRPFEWTEKQQRFIDIVTDHKTNIVICKGVSGTAKTLLSVYCGLVLMNKKATAEMIYVRTPCESSSFNLGFLKGSLEEKFAPYTGPLEDKMRELLSKGDRERLFAEERVRSKPIGFIRGESFNVSYIIAEESQNFKIEDFLLLMTRLGKRSKMIFIGDENQTDIKQSALQKVYDLFNDDESAEKGIHTFEFDKSDIMRNDILSFVIDKFESQKD